MTTLHTARLRLEPLRDDHFDGLFAINSRPEVMHFINGRPETQAETWTMIERVKERWVEFGFSWWAFVHAETVRMAGAGCIQHLQRDITQPLEIGWRLHPDFWRQGLASEAAACMAAFAFDALQADDLVAVRVAENRASGRVMDRLGMRFRGTGHWYGRPGVMHGITAVQWRERTVPGNAAIAASP